jgi:hypothetical protein
MALRASKPSFNVREKLTELGRRFGLKGSQLAAAETAQEARDLVSAGRKNMIINGAMLISQRYSSAQSIPSGSQPYFIDRFSSRNNNDGSASVSHSAEAPNGFYRSMRIEVTSPDTSLASNQYLRFQQYIEGHNIFCDWGKGNTDHLTLSFWVRSSLPGIYSASLEDGDALPLHIKEYQIDNADTWEYKTLTFPPPPTGTFSTAGTGTGMRLTMVQASGTQNQSSPNNWKTGSYYHASTRQVDFTKQTGNFYITGIQLEVGKNATEFEHRSYGEELALCQRYFQRVGRARGSGNRDAGSNNCAFSHNIPTMRAIPDCTFVTQGNDYNFSGKQFQNINESHVSVLVNITTADNYWYYNHGYEADAEL